MTEHINWSLRVQVLEGPSMSTSDTIEVGAYDKIDVGIPEGGELTPVEVLPDGDGEVRFLSIRSDRYDPPLTYHVLQGAIPDPIPEPAEEDVITLDGQQVFFGAGAVELLGGRPEKLIFANAGEGEVGVEILVGRMTSAEPE